MFQIKKIKAQLLTLKNHSLVSLKITQQYLHIEMKTLVIIQIYQKLQNLNYYLKILRKEEN